MSDLQLVCVSHEMEIYEQFVGRNPYLQAHRIFLYDNRVQNIGISIRYNEFIDSHMASDSWVVFFHHDFEFEEDPGAVVSNLRLDSIYGVIGVCLDEGAFSESTITSSGREALTRHFLGQIRQGSVVKPVTLPIGERLRAPEIVDTVDCCCLIVHSSIIRKHRLRFDTKLPWHLYSEELSLTAWSRHRVPTRVAQVEGTHHGTGPHDFVWEDEFWQSVAYLRAKYADRAVPSTVISPRTRRKLRLF